MADNVTSDPGSGGSVFATASGTWSGDTANFPGCFLAIVSGSEGSWSIAQVVGGAGAVAAGVQRMTLASDDPAVATLGGVSDAAATQGSTGSISAKLRTATSQLNTGNTSLASIDGKITACNTGAVVVSSSALPSGASTAAKQPALGTAGTASADVITVQGITSMTALKVDGSAVTQPISIAAALPAGTNGIGKLTANTGVTIGAVEIAAAQTLATVTTVSTVTTCSTVTTVSTLTGGGVAHGGADSGNPLKIGVKATASVKGETPVDAADRTDLYAGTDGVLMTRPHSSLEDIISEIKTNTDGASTAMTGAFAATASQRIYLTTLIIANSSASNITVDIRDGSAGSVLITVPVPATGGAVINFPVPLRFSANTAAAFDGSAAATTLSVSMIGFKSKA